jgi:hypothetical protein
VRAWRPDCVDGGRGIRRDGRCDGAEMSRPLEQIDVVAVVIVVVSTIGYDNDNDNELSRRIYRAALDSLRAPNACR